MNFRALYLFLIGATLCVPIEADNECYILKLEKDAEHDLYRNRKYFFIMDNEVNCWTHEINIDGNETDHLYMITGIVPCADFYVEIDDGHRKSSDNLRFDSAVGHVFVVPAKFEGKTKVTFKSNCSHDQDRSQYQYISIDYTRNNRIARTYEEIVRVEDDTILGFTTTGFERNSSGNDTRVTILAPENARIVMGFELYSGDINLYYPVLTYEGLEANEGSVINVREVKYESPSFPISSKGNAVTVVFPLQKDSLKYRTTIVKSRIYVLKNELDCLYDYYNTNCKWLNTNPERNPSVFLMQPEVNITEPLCMSLKYNSYGRDSNDVFFVAMETNNASHVLFKEYGILDRNIIGRLVHFSVPAFGFGTILMFLKTEYERSFINAITIRTKIGQCYTTLHANLDCDFKETLCEWRAMPDGMAKYDLSHKVSLKRGGRIISPKMKKGDHCFEFSSSGNGRLSLQVSNGSHTVSRRSYLVDNSLIEMRRIVLKDVTETTRIILEATGMINKDEQANVQIHKTLLLPETECKVDTGRFNWEMMKYYYGDFDLLAIRNESMQVQTKLLTDTSKDNDHSISVFFPRMDSKKWFCFRYQFLTTPIANNLCLAIRTQGKHFEEKLVWRQCSPVYRSETKVCIGLPILSDYFKVKVLVQPVDVISQGRIRVSRPDQVYSTLDISSNWIGDTAECSIHSFECGWFQMGKMNKGFWIAEKERLTYSHTFSEKSGLIDYIRSPPITVDNPADVCVTFTLETMILTSVRITMEQYLTLGYQSIIVTVIPKKNNVIKQTLSLRKGDNYLGLALIPLEEDKSNDEPYHIVDFQLVYEPCAAPTPNMTCDFDSNQCSWNIDTKYSIQNFKTFYADPEVQNKLTPKFDGKMNEKGSYVTLYSSSSEGNVVYATATSPTYTPLTKNQCVAFHYLMTGSDKIDHTLKLDLMSKVGKTKNLWSQEDSQEMSWYIVQFPINATLPVNATIYDSYRLRFHVESVVKNETSEFVVSLDSVSVSEGTECERLHESVPLDQFLLSNVGTASTND